MRQLKRKGKTVVQERGKDNISKSYQEVTEQAVMRI